MRWLLAFVLAAHAACSAPAETAATAAELGNPRDGAAWSRTKVDDVGWLMSLEPVAGAHGADFVISDRAQIVTPAGNLSTKLGARLLHKLEDGTYASETIDHVPASEGFSRFLTLPRPGVDVVDIVSGPGKPNQITLRVARGIAPGYFELAIAPPANIGELHDVDVCDVNRDGKRDLLLSSSGVDVGESGIVALLGPDFTQLLDISGPAPTAEKWDNVGCHTIGGELAIVSTEQVAGYGLVAFRLVAGVWARGELANLLATNGGPGGADGYSLAFVDGYTIIAVAYEQAMRTQVVRLLTLDGPIEIVTLSQVGNAEDVKLGFVDDDAAIDVVTASESGWIEIHFGSTSAPFGLASSWTPMRIESSVLTPNTRWMQLALGDFVGNDGVIEVAGGGRTPGAMVAIFSVAP